jgi:putative lipoprotein (rSAM/lipoprotein system)
MNGRNFMKTTSERIRRIIRKIYTGLGLTTVALVFQACYGTPQAMGLDVLIRGVVKSNKTKDPIEGIKISVKDRYQSDLTDSAGTFVFFIPQDEMNSLQLELEDIDGPENGLYLSKTISVELSKDETNLGDILLDVAE